MPGRQPALAPACPCAPLSLRANLPRGRLPRRPCGPSVPAGPVRPVVPSHPCALCAPRPLRTGGSRLPWSRAPRCTLRPLARPPPHPCGPQRRRNRCAGGPVCLRSGGASARPHRPRPAFPSLPAVRRPVPPWRPRSRVAFAPTRPVSPCTPPHRVTLTPASPLLGITLRAGFPSRLRPGGNRYPFARGTRLALRPAVRSLPRPCAPARPVPAVPLQRLQATAN